MGLVAPTIVTGRACTRSPTIPRCPNGRKNPGRVLALSRATHHPQSMRYVLLLLLVATPLAAQSSRELLMDPVGCDSALLADRNRKHPEWAEQRRNDCRAERWPGVSVDSASAQALGCDADVLDSIRVLLRPLTEASEQGTVEQMGERAIPEPGWTACLVLALWGFPADERLVRIGTERGKTWTFRRWNRMHLVTLREAKGERRTGWVVTAVDW